MPILAVNAARTNAMRFAKHHSGYRHHSPGDSCFVRLWLHADAARTSVRPRRSLTNHNETAPTVAERDTVGQRGAPDRHHPSALPSGSRGASRHRRPTFRSPPPAVLVAALGQSQRWSNSTRPSDPQLPMQDDLPCSQAKLRARGIPYAAASPAVVSVSVSS